MIFLAIIIFILILGLLIFVHELGHFVMAKRAGMRVEEFGFGFPPRIFGLRKNGTLYSLNWIPLGGFVKILGENGESAEPDSFAAQSALKRFSVLIAGVSMNAVLAWLLISVGLTIGLPTLISEGETLPNSARQQEPKVTILHVEPQAPASEADLKNGDVIVSIDGRNFSRIEEVQDYTTAQAGRRLVYIIQRGSRQHEISLIPRVNPPAGQGPIGVVLGLVAKVSYPWYEAVWRGITSTLSLIVQIVLAVGALLKDVFTERSLVGSLTGPIGIAVLTRDATALGLAHVIYFTAVLSVNLAIINALPFPALDGGRVLFLLIEKLRRKKLNIKVEHYANTIGFALLIMLMIWVTFRDVDRYSEQFKKLFERMF